MYVHLFPTNFLHLYDHLLSFLLQNFRRRSYRLIDKNYSKYCIVHYRLSSDDDRHDQHSVPQSVLHHASKFLPPGTIQIPESMKGKEGAPLKIEQQEEEQDLDWVGYPCFLYKTFSNIVSCRCLI